MVLSFLFPLTLSSPSSAEITRCIDSSIIAAVEYLVLGVPQRLPEHLENGHLAALFAALKAEHERLLGLGRIVVLAECG